MPHLCITLMMIGGITVPSTAGATTKLLRFPDIHGDRVVFTYGGDLWIVPTSGGTARRLTSHPGVELFGKFSPDGRHVAFTGQYEGLEQVYVVPAAGGIPKQLTFYPSRKAPDRWGYDNQVYGWHPDGRRILFRSLRESHSISKPRLFLVSIDGGLPTALAPPVAGAGALSADGTRLFYSPLFRDFRTWKRYQGGWAQDLYVMELTKPALTRITKHERTDRDPMWLGDALTFASDRDGRLNLFRHEKGRAVQLTQHRDWDVRWPSSDGTSRIVYELGGELRIYDAKTKRDVGLSITVPTDSLPTRARRQSVAGNITDYDLSPHGNRVLFVARGDLFDAPVEHGLTKNLTHSSNAHDREAQWSPDGTTIAYVSDLTGEEQIWTIDVATGTTTPRTTGDLGRLYGVRWAPDGERLAFVNNRGLLQVLTLETGALTVVAMLPYESSRDYAWSPHGGHLAYTMGEQTWYESLYIWSVKDEISRRLTGPMFEARAPAWDPSGDYLFFLSDREYTPQLGAFDFDWVADRETVVLAVALRSDVAHPFSPRNDRDQAAKSEDEKKNEPGPWKADEIAKADDVRIDFEGLSDRVARVPVGAGNWSAVVPTRTHLLLFDEEAPYLDREDIHATLSVFDREKRELKPLAAKVQGFAVSYDRTQVVVRDEEGFRRYTLGSEDEPKTVATGGLVSTVDPREEWSVIFDEVWRRYREYFYVENMHGYDWPALRRQYRGLLPHVGHRSDLTYILGEMVAELSVGHAYVSGGDLRSEPRPGVALLGARLELDADAKRYRIAEILPGQNEETLYRSPLTEVGVNAAAGDYLLAINGQELLASENPYRLLQGDPKIPVELTLSKGPSFEGARTVVVQPIATENHLRYLAAVEASRRRVAEATQGEVGYLHVPNMMGDGAREFMKWFYPQSRKRGLIVDVRNNGGGFLSQTLIERLARPLLGTGFARNYRYPDTYPARAFPGPMACLIDELSGSDGDIFPWAFRAAGLGPLIGKRTWGGVIGISDHGPLLDGGVVYVPEFSTNGPDGSYILEGIGVRPDIEIDNDPIAVLEGHDPQLERAIAEVQKARTKNPGTLPRRPPDPVKTPEK